MISLTFNLCAASSAPFMRLKTFCRSRPLCAVSEQSCQPQIFKRALNQTIAVRATRSAMDLATGLVGCLRTIRASAE